MISLRIKHATIVLCTVWLLAFILIYAAIKPASGDYYAAKTMYIFEKETAEVEWEESMEPIIVEFQIPSLLVSYSVRPMFVFELETSFGSEPAKEEVLVLLTFSCNGHIYFRDFLRAIGDVRASGLYSDAYLNPGAPSPELTDDTLLRTGRNNLEIAISITSKGSEHNPTAPGDKYVKFTMSEVRVRVEPKELRWDCTLSYSVLS